MPSTSVDVDRTALIEWYRRNRARTKALFGLLTEDAYYDRPIELRHPIVFYDGHLPGFSFNTLVKRGLGLPSIDKRLEAIFARGIDPRESQVGREGLAADEALWPSRQTVQEFAAEADRHVVAALECGDIARDDHPLLDRAEAAFVILEHEAMHQETLLYMWHQLPYGKKRRPDTYLARTEGRSPTQEWIEVPAGPATLGVDRHVLPFSWDNERPARAVDVDAFEIERHNVTNLAFAEFVDAGGYDDPRWWRPDDWAWVQTENVRHPRFWEQDDRVLRWRGMFERFPLPPSWPVYVSHAEATAYVRWRGLRLPTEAEYQRAAYAGASIESRPYPWGDAPPSADHGVFDFSGWEPKPVGSHPAGRSPWGIDDLLGNGWEWTSTVFGPFPGFVPTASYPEYSADFFDGEHFVMKGASSATASELLRPTFRNWFRPRYPYVYATFRCARDCV